jgi:hypothetical protein
MGFEYGFEGSGEAWTVRRVRSGELEALRPAAKSTSTYEKCDTPSALIWTELARSWQLCPDREFKRLHSGDRWQNR